MHIGAFARRTGVAEKTLRYYDEIGLLKPGSVGENGYRQYGEPEVLRLQEILYWRELGFPLGEIPGLVASPMTRREKLARQREFLVERQRRTTALIAQIDRDLEENTMDFTGFDTKAEEGLRAEYAREAKARWGDTPAYAQSAAKGKAAAAEGREALEWVFRAAAAVRTAAPDSREAGEIVTALRETLTRYFYDCTPALLRGLGELYTADDRFREHIDRAGEGTAAFLSAAIAAHTPESE